MYSQDDIAGLLRDHGCQLQELRAEIAVLKRRPSNSRQIPKHLYHINELSQMTGLSVRALKGRRERGQFRAHNEGNDIFITNKECERFIKWLGGGN